VKGTNSRGHMTTMVRMTSIPPFSAGASSHDGGRGRIPREVLQRVELL
jgi:hypothetical protein